MGKYIRYQLKFSFNLSLTFLFTVLATNLSLVISFLSSILIFSAMQFCKQVFLSSQMMTIFAGITGSWLFLLLLTVSWKFQCTSYF